MRMSKLDFSRQAVPLGEHADVHDIIASFRTSANLPNLSDDLLDNSNDNDQRYSPVLISFDDANSNQVGDNLLSRSLNNSSSSLSTAKEKPFLHDSGNDSYVNTTTSSFTAVSTYNSLRRGYRRAQDVSLAAVPCHWRKQPSSSCHDESDAQQTLQLFEPKPQKLRPLSCATSKQFSSLKTLDRELIRSEKYDHVNNKQNHSSSHWNESRRRYFSIDLHSELHDTIPRPLSATLSLPSASSTTSSLTLERFPELRTRMEHVESYKQHPKVVENHPTSYENNYVSLEANCAFVLENNSFPLSHETSRDIPRESPGDFSREHSRDFCRDSSRNFSHQTSPHDFSRETSGDFPRLTSIISLKHVTKDTLQPAKTVTSSISIPTAFISSIPENNLNDIKVEYMPLPTEGLDTANSLTQEEVRLVDTRFCRYSICSFEKKKGFRTSCFSIVLYIAAFICTNLRLALCI